MRAPLQPTSPPLAQIPYVRLLKPLGARSGLAVTRSAEDCRSTFLLRLFLLRLDAGFELRAGAVVDN